MTLSAAIDPIVEMIERSIENSVAFGTPAVRRIPREWAARQFADASRTIGTDSFADIVVKARTLGWALHRHFRGNELALLQVKEGYDAPQEVSDDWAAEELSLLSQRIGLGDHAETMQQALRIGTALNRLFNNHHLAIGEVVEGFAEASSWRDTGQQPAPAPQQLAYVAG